MKVKITDVGLPIGVVTGGAGFHVGFEYNGKHASAFIKPGESLKLALYNAANIEEMRQRAMGEAEKFAEEVKKLIGQEIEVLNQNV